MSWLDALLNIGTQIGGALISSNANSGAADRAGQANADAARIYADAQVKAGQTYADAQQRAVQTFGDAQRDVAGITTAAQQRGFDEYKALIDQAIAEATTYNDRARGIYSGMEDESRPAVDYLRGVAFANPYEFTPWQQTARTNTLRDANARLAASGLRGAGRAGVATVNKAAQDFDNAAWASNRGRADSAAGQMYGANQNAQNNMAATDRATGSTRANLLTNQGAAARDTANAIGSANAGAASSTGQFAANSAASTGSFLANSQTQTGNNAATLTRDAGQTEANADLANARDWGSAIGALSSIIAGEIKGRNGVYGQRYNAGQI